MNQEELIKLTKAELAQMVVSLQSQVEDLTEQLKARDAALSGSGEPGWLITTPSPSYSSRTAGVQFHNGRAWIGESNPDAEKLVILLTRSFGYRAQKMTAEDFKKLQPAAAEAADPMLKLVTPKVRGA